MPIGGSVPKGGTVIVRSYSQRLGFRFSAQNPLCHNFFFFFFSPSLYATSYTTKPQLLLVALYPACSLVPFNNNNNNFDFWHWLRRLECGKCITWPELEVVHLLELRRVCGCAFSAFASSHHHLDMNFCYIFLLLLVVLSAYSESPQYGKPPDPLDLTAVKIDSFHIWRHHMTNHDFSWHLDCKAI